VPAQGAAAAYGGAAAPSGFGGGAYAGAPTGGAQAGAGAFAPQQGGGIEQLVLSFFQTKGESSESGCTVAEAADALAANGASIDQVRQLVENLVGDGHLYSTIDDDHFKATT